jgi:hypothetical protein
MTIEKAPSTFASTTLSASSRGAPALTSRASNSATKSESESIVVYSMPTPSASEVVFVRLPLCARANPDAPAER